MNANCAFVASESINHFICQDYARANNKPFIVLSDGCSSSPETDFGSRILTKSAETCLLKFFNGDPTKDFFLTTIIHAWQNSLVLNLPIESLDATLLVASIQGSIIKVACRGDGSVVFKKYNGDIEWYEISYSYNAPAYLSYELDPLRKKMFLDANIERLVCYTDKNGTNELGVSKSMEEFNITKDKEDYEFVVLFSDGCCAIVDQDNKSVSTFDVIKELSNFKMVKRSPFVENRLRKFVRDMSYRKWKRNDDLAVAAIYLGE